MPPAKNQSGGMMEQPHEQSPDPNSDPLNITEDRAARRFHQMRRMETNLTKLDKRITDAKDKLAKLKEQREAQIDALLAAARDEGDLPLFDDLD
jgi:septal ring factor EnvC (AmiA/AmiB activator)